MRALRFITYPIKTLEESLARACLRPELSHMIPGEELNS